MQLQFILSFPSSSYSSCFHAPTLLLPPLLLFACTPRDSSPRRFWAGASRPPTRHSHSLLKPPFLAPRHSPPPKRKMDESQRTQVADATFRDMSIFVLLCMLYMKWRGVKEVKPSRAGSQPSVLNTSPVFPGPDTVAPGRSQTEWSARRLFVVYHIIS